MFKTFFLLLFFVLKKPTLPLRALFTTRVTRYVVIVKAASLRGRQRSGSTDGSTSYQLDINYISPAH